MQLRFAAVVLLTVAAVFVVTPRAQNPAAPAQPDSAPGARPEPNPLGQPLLDANGFVREDAMLRSPLLAADARYTAIEGRRLRQFLMEVDAISLKDKASGNLFWGRNVGTAGHEATQAWVEGYFKKLGLQNVHRLPFDLAPQWTPNAWQPARQPNPAHVIGTDGDCAWVADVGGTVVGHAMGFVRGDIWFLSQLFVMPEMHSGGIGAELLRLAVASGRADPPTSLDRRGPAAKCRASGRRPSLRLGPVPLARGRHDPAGRAGGLSGRARRDRPAVLAAGAPAA